MWRYWVIAISSISVSLWGVPGENALNDLYESACQQQSDINQHVPILCDLSSQCGSVAEIGLRGMVSTWGILKGLSENKLSHRNYIGIDIASPNFQTLKLAYRVSHQHGIDFVFIPGNDMTVDIPQVDMLFIDSLHTYCHLMYELEKFSPFVSKYIAMHDTSDPWGTQDDSSYSGNYSEYPDTIDKQKRGLWQAVEDFLIKHPEWSLLERRTNCHGFTVLIRAIGLNSSNLSGCDRRPCNFCSSSISTDVNSSQNLQVLGLAPKCLDEFKPMALIKNPNL